MKFIGDDSTATPVTKKLNDTLQIRGDGTYDKDKNTVADDGNIKTSVDNGAVKVSLSDKINLHQGGYLTVGGDTREGQDPILIKNFGAGDLTVTGKIRTVIRLSPKLATMSAAVQLPKISSRKSVIPLSQTPKQRLVSIPKLLSMIRKHLQLFLQIKWVQLITVIMSVEMTIC